MISYATISRVLNQLTPVEEQLKNNEFTLDFADQKKTVLDGQEIFVFGVAPAYPFLVFPNPNIKITQTVRFTPIPTHIHSCIEIGYMYSGSCQHTVKGSTYTLTQGQLYILDSDTPHSIGRLGEKDILISFTLERQYFTDSFFTRFTDTSVLLQFLLNSISEHTYHDNFVLFHIDNNRRVSVYINEIICEHFNPSINAGDIINNYVTLLFLELVNIYETNTVNQELHLLHNNIVPILKYIESNYKTCDLQSTAKIFNMNPNYLTTFIKKYTGYSFKQLIQRQKFQYINNQLLNTSLSIEEIAVSLGYENTTYFYKKYKEIFGCTPAEFRKQRKSLL